MSVSPTSRDRHLPVMEPAPLPVAVSSPPDAQQDIGPISEAARIVAQQNRLAGGHPLIQEAGDLLQSIAIKPDPTSYSPNGIEFYRPNLSLADLMGIGARYVDGNVYHGAGGAVSGFTSDMDYSAIYLIQYTDQAERIYEELLKKYPESQESLLMKGISPNIQPLRISFVLPKSLKKN